MPEHGEIVWHELNAWDVDASRTFYSRLFGWTWDAMPMPGGDGTYWIAMRGDQTVGGVFPLSSPVFDGVPAHWMTYFEVSNVDATAEETAAAGGAVLRPAFDVPGVGRIAIVKDSGGAVVGVMTSAARA